MSPKFNTGDIVYFRDEENFVTNVNWHPSYGTVYNIVNYTNGDAMGPVMESILLSKMEWEAKQRGSQNHIGRVAFERGFSIEPKKVSACVCGAHKVKDSRHSSWCEIKN